RIADALARAGADMDVPVEVPEDGPYPGLESFGEDRARFFFGRRDEVRDLCHRLGFTDAGYRRWLHVQGASGSGKSSLVRAGFVPAVRRGLLGRLRAGGVRDVPESWRVAVFRPGADPARNLVEAVAAALGHAGQEKDATVERLRSAPDRLAVFGRELQARGE